SRTYNRTSPDATPPRHAEGKRNMRIAYFTSTMGGAGHIALAVSIERGLRRNGFAGDYRIFGPKVPWFGVDQSTYVECRVDALAQRDPVLARNSAVARALARYRPDLLLVDKFWVPLVHILPMLRCEAWLLLHYAPAGWMSQPAAALGVDPRPQYAR